MPSALLLGRLLYGGFFLFMGLNHFINLPGLVGYASSKNVPAPQAMVLLGGVLLALGGLSVLLGFYPRVGLTLLVLFLVPVSLKMHDFWNLTDAAQRQMEMVQFLKNTALAGAALALMAMPVPWPRSVGTPKQRGSGTPRATTDWAPGRRLEQ